eukprot:NODE_15478_length_1048_cov_4.140065.p2 GENE.NODE_15478_length_1048_cov_4.140065~~NODE_15478_length_1048_cov_4.140065.p2  ORF type:complete len:183 (-),score=48.43 NODE_15478_length_1048_cov_4.140065:475-1023(-)
MFGLARVVLAAFFLLLRNSWAGRFIPPKGAKIPEFNLPNHLGEVVSLRDLPTDESLTKVLLFWYPGKDLEGRGRAKEGKRFKELYDEYRAAGVQVVGISIDSPGQNKAFVDKFGFPFPILSDRKMAIPKGMGHIHGGAAKLWGVVVNLDYTIVYFWRAIDPETWPDSALQLIQSEAGAGTEL